MGLLTTVCALPAFADVPSVRSPAIAASESVAICDSATLTTSENGATVNFKAIWKPKIYSCETGKYLNKENAVCVPCLAGHYCPGFSDFPFDETNLGLNKCPDDYPNVSGVGVAESDCFRVADIACSEKNPYVYGNGVPVYRNAVTQCKQYSGNNSCDLIDEHACDIVVLNCAEGFVPQPVDGTLRCIKPQIHCEAGEYVPAGEQTPVKCPENSYCPGGDYTFNQNQASGKFECPEGLKAPEGAKLLADCGIILHIGEDKLYMHSDKSTRPSLAVRAKDKNWYANTTPVSEGEKPISDKPGSKKLHINVNGTEYTVHGRYVEAD